MKESIKIQELDRQTTFLKTACIWMLAVPVCAYVSGSRLSAHIMDWVCWQPPVSEQQSGPVGETVLTGTRQLKGLLNRDCTNTAG